MIELSMLDAFALTALRLVAGANIGMALALLVAIGFWLLSCGLDSESHSTRGA